MQAVAQAQRRGSKLLTIEDLIFLIRHDKTKVNRIRHFLSWKEIKKKVTKNDAEPAEPDNAEEMLEDTNRKIQTCH